MINLTHHDVSRNLWFSMGKGKGWVRLIPLLVLHVIVWFVGVFLMLVFLKVPAQAPVDRIFPPLAPPPLTVRLVSFHEDKTIPMYYINLDASTERRLFIETFLSTLGNLTRIPAVTIQELDSLFEMHFGMPLQQYKKHVIGEDGEIAATMSHLRAMETAWNDKVPFALIFEDDVGPHYIPFWTVSVGDLVLWMDNNEPEWELLRLQYVFTNLDFASSQYLTWRTNPDRHIVSHRNIVAYGAAAMLWSRRGLEKIRQKLRTSTGAYDCRFSSSRCCPDHILVNELDAAFLKYPPMFSHRLMEGSTGMRTGKFNSVNDHWYLHQTALAFGSKWVMEDFEFRATQAISSENFTLENQPLSAFSVVMLNSHLSFLRKILNKLNFRSLEFLV